MTIRRLPRVLGVVLGVVAAAPLRAQSPGPAGDPPVLHPGDAVRITVWRKAELSGEFAVAGDGSLIHPLYRAVVVARLPLPAVEARLRAFLEGYELNPQFVVEPLFHVTVGGEVVRPSLYLVPPQATIAEALALAGGANERGRRDRVRLLRDAANVTVDLTRPPAGLAQPSIRPGDQIFVERRPTVFRDVVVPFIGITGSIAAIITVIRYRR